MKLIKPIMLISFLVNLQTNIDSQSVSSEGEMISREVEELIKQGQWKTLQIHFAEKVTIFVSADGPEITFFRKSDFQSRPPGDSLREAIFEDTGIQKLGIKSPSIANMLKQSQKRRIIWEPKRNEPGLEIVTSSTILMHTTKQQGFAIYFKRISGKWLITGIGVQEFLTD
jgi:hypothetical protein